ncbi:hypothetical protein GCM10028807_63090 [Spirosoma daeguense]
MKKPWRFTPKQVRSDQPEYNNNWRKAFQFYNNHFQTKAKNYNNRQCWLEQHNWIDDAVYQKPPTKNNVAWHFW